jgi:hypothetical protein
MKLYSCSLPPWYVLGSLCAISYPASYISSKKRRVTFSSLGCSSMRSCRTNGSLADSRSGLSTSHSWASMSILRISMDMPGLSCPSSAHHRGQRLHLAAAVCRFQSPAMEIDSARDALWSYRVVEGVHFAVRQRLEDARLEAVAIARRAEKRGQIHSSLVTRTELGRDGVDP